MLIAVDAGYCDTKLVSQNDQFKFPSVVGQPRQRTLIPDRAGIMDELHVEVDGREWFIGQLALRESTDASRTLDGVKIDTSVTLSLVGCALIASDTASIDLITGLPVSHFNAQKSALYQKLVGRHSVRFLSGKLAGRNVILNSKHVIVFPQGAGAFFGRVLNPAGRPVVCDESRGNWALIDIGYKTTDFVSFEDLQYIDRHSGSLGIGISDAHKAILKRWNEQGLEYLLADVEKQASPREPEFAETATKILRNVTPIVGNAKLLFAGGGALALAPNLPGRVLHQGEYANAVGFYRIGLARLGVS